MNVIRKYWVIARISARSNFAYAGEVGSRLFFLGVILFIFMCLWKDVYHNARVTLFGAYTLADVVWYLALAESIVMSAPRLTPQVDEDVRTGTIAVQLVRPLSYPLYVLASNLGEQVVRFTVTAFAAVVIALLLASPPTRWPLGVLFTVLALPGAFVLNLLGYFLIGLAAFWLEDTSGMTLIYARLTAIFGGMQLPPDVFPWGITGILKALPFGCMVSGPARQLVHPDALALCGLITQQMMWIVVFGAAVATVYSKAVHRITVQGG
jgi:ABC-2 type transport system permease protein